MEEWQLYNLTPGYLFTFSPDGTILNMNAILLNDLGYTAGEIVNVVKLEHLLTPGSCIFFQTHLFPLIKMQGSVKELYLLFKTKENSRLPVLLNAFVEKNTDGFKVHCAGMEISNRNQFEKELTEAKNTAETALLENRELVKMKKQLQLNQHVLEKQLHQITRFNYENSQINKVLSHDLQEPLRKIILFTGLIEDLLESEHPSQQYFSKIKRFTARVRNLINSMQRFNSLDTSDIRHTEVILEELIHKARGSIDYNNVHITYTSNEKFTLKADEALLANLFIELITNACKFKHPDREPEITITSDIVFNNIFRHTENRYKYENFARIRVEDNGSGFDNRYSKQVFELFRKLHDTDGIGIGLPYCKKIVEMHNGAITVYSTENTGTKFTILLPLEPIDVLTPHLDLLEKY